MTFGIPVGVSTEPVLHAGCRVGLRSSQEEVDVIWHPAIGDHVPRGALHFVSQTVCEPSLVGQSHFESLPLVFKGLVPCQLVWQEAGV